MGHDEDSGVVIFIICNSPDFSGNGRNSDGAQDPAGKAWILYLSIWAEICRFLSWVPTVSCRNAMELAGNHRKNPTESGP